MTENSLFRSEAIKYKKNPLHGHVFINLPLHYALIATGLITLMTVVICIFIFAEFSEKFIVSGYVTSTQASVQVYPKNEGIIIRSYHHQGDRVKKGDKLFVIDTSYARNKFDELEIYKQLLRGREAIEKEIQYKNKHLKAIKDLLVKKYVSLNEYNIKREELAVLENRKRLIEMDIIKFKQTESYSVLSPIDGIVSSMWFKEGQYTKSSKPLAKLIPKGAELIAELFVPARYAGFLNKNNEVVIHYDAYPHERFGSYQANILDISQSIMTDDDEDKPIKIGEPYYKITAKLKKQCVTVYGKDKKIQHGMTLSAVLVGSKRKIWQWVLDPLYSFYGAIFV